MPEKQSIRLKTKMYSSESELQNSFVNKLEENDGCNYCCLEFKLHLDSVKMSLFQ